MPPEITGIDLVLFGEEGSENTAVRVETDAGATGEYVSYSAYGFHKAATCAPWLVGKNPLAREHHWSECKRMLRKYDLLGLSVLDIALWDLAGKHHGEPVHALLGTYRERLPAYLSVGVQERHRTDDLPGRYADTAEAAHEAGYRGFKVRFSRRNVRDVDEVDKDAEVDLIVDSVHAVGERVGDEMDLMLDTTTELETFADALEVGRACDEQGYFWYEDPFKDGGQSAHAHRKLRQRLDTPLLMTELVRGFEVHTDFAEAEATDFLRGDPFYDGGITGSVKMARAAEGFGLDIEFHGGSAACQHCIAASRNANYLEFTTSMDDAADHFDDVDDEGMVDVSNEPGLGETHDWDDIEDRAILSRRYE